MSVGKVLSNDRLKGILTDSLVFRGAAYNSLNDINLTGFYTTTPTNHVTDLPEGAYQYGFLIHLKAPDRTLQVYVSIGTGNPVYVRSWANNTWRPWTQISVSGGVKRCTSSAREQKGGWRYEYGKDSDGRKAERVTAERDGVSGNLHGLGYMCNTWFLHHSLEHRTSSKCNLRIIGLIGGDVPYERIENRDISEIDMLGRFNDSNSLFELIKQTMDCLECDTVSAVDIAYGKEVAA